MQKSTADKKMFAASVILIVVIVVLIATILLLPLVYKTGPSSTRDTSVNVTTPTNVGSNVAIEEIPIQQSGNVIYRIRGRFANDLYFDQDVLLGDFLIKDEKSQTPARVIFPKKNGYLLVTQENVANSGTQPSFTYKKTLVDDFKNMVVPGKLVQLQFTAYARDGVFFQDTKAMMQALILGQPPNQNTVLMPSHVVILE